MEMPRVSDHEKKESLFMEMSQDNDLKRKKSIHGNPT